MAASPESSGALTAWPVHGEAEFEWRRVRRWLGPMPIEISLAGTVVGRLVAADPLGRRYAARTASAVWEFAAHGLWRQRCVAVAEESVVCASSEKAGFRRRNVRFEPGPQLAWQQLGLRGNCYRLSTAHDGTELLTVRNTDGALRWHGVIDVREAALPLDHLLPLAVLFSTFLVFSSSELSS